MSVTFAQIEVQALTIPVKDRARLADRLLESLSCRQGLEVTMTPGLERLLDEGLEDLGKAITTRELRGQ